MNRLFHPSPSAAVENVADGGLVNSVQTSDFPLCLPHAVKDPDPRDIFCSKPRGVRCGSPLFNTVPHVVETRSGKKMRRVHTRRIIASVADHHPFRDRAFEQFVGEFCRLNPFPLDPEKSISSAGCCARPQPTIIGSPLVHFFPKAFLGRVFLPTKANELRAGKFHSLSMKSKELYVNKKGGALE